MVFKAAIVQMRSGLDPQKTAQSLEPMLMAAISEGASYLQTPEMTACVHNNRDSMMAMIKPQDQDPIVQMAERLSRKHQVIIHIGSTAIPLEDGKVANRAFMFQNGELLATYDKIHMFDVDLDHGESWRESNSYAPGEQAVIVETDHANIGMGICYDVRFPHLFRDQAIAGADILTAPAAFTKQTGEAHWHILQRARAIENGAFMISAAQGGMHEDGRQTYGHSLIIDPWGQILAELNHSEPGFAMADIDVSLSQAARSKIPNLKNARDYDIEIVEPTE